MKLDKEYIELGASANWEYLIPIALDNMFDNTHRQDVYKAHVGSYATIGRFGEDENYIDYPVLADMKPAVAEVLESVNKYYGFKDINFYKAILAVLPPGRGCLRHEDKAPIMEKCHRVHLCVKTNEDVKFVVGNVTIPFKPGKIIEISNQGFEGHYVVNNSEEVRIHLIVDCYDNFKE